MVRWPRLVPGRSGDGLRSKASSVIEGRGARHGPQLDRRQASMARNEVDLAEVVAIVRSMYCSAPCSASRRQGPRRCVTENRRSAAGLAHAPSKHRPISGSSGGRAGRRWAWVRRRARKHPRRPEHHVQHDLPDGMTLARRAGADGAHTGEPPRPAAAVRPSSDLAQMRPKALGPRILPPLCTSSRSVALAMWDIGPPGNLAMQIQNRHRAGVPRLPPGRPACGHLRRARGEPQTPRKDTAR